MIKVSVQFCDENMPNINVDTASAQLAVSTLRGLFKQYAGLKSGWIQYSDLSKDVFAPDGSFLFGIPGSEAPLMRQEEYLEKGGVVCPKCGSPDINGGFIETDAGQAVQPVTCNDCHFRWQDNYKLVGYEVNQ